MDDKQVIDCEALLDQCWAMLNKKYEEAHAKLNWGYHKPEFVFTLSHEQIRALQRHANNMAGSAKVFVGIDNQMLFGHPLIEQQRTPYLRVI